MLSSEQVDIDGRRTVLCVKSRRAGTFLESALASYECCVVHDTKTACRKAKLGAFDLYLAVDPYMPNAAVECWQSIREFDGNTPFVFVLRKPLPPAIGHCLVADVDACVLFDDGPSALAQCARRLLMLAERRSLEARREQTLVIREVIQERFARLEWRLQLSRQSMARAQEHVIRGYAMQEFTRRGGTKSFFERMWPDAYEDALRHDPTPQAAPPAAVAVLPESPPAVADQPEYQAITTK